jgi:hypothetical protein
LDESAVFILALQCFRHESHPAKNRELQKLIHVGDCLYRSSRTNVYYAIFQRDGKQVKRSLGASADAQRLCAVVAVNRERTFQQGSS